MLVINEVCKRKGTTLQSLAKKMRISYQALHASINNNPSLKRLEDIANALEVDVTELFAPKSDDFTALIDHGGKLYRFDSVESLEAFIAEIKEGETE